MWHTYILECQDGSLYTGATNDLEKRFQDHLSGKGAKYTRAHKPLKIVYSEQFSTQGEALKREAEIKKMSRAQKLKIIL